MRYFADLCLHRAILLLGFSQAGDICFETAGVSRLSPPAIFKHDDDTFTMRDFGRANLHFSPAPSTVFRFADFRTIGLCLADDILLPAIFWHAPMRLSLPFLSPCHFFNFIRPGFPPFALWGYGCFDLSAIMPGDDSLISHLENARIGIGRRFPAFSMLKFSFDFHYCR